MLRSCPDRSTAQTYAVVRQGKGRALPADQRVEKVCDLGNGCAMLHAAPRTRCVPLMSLYRARSSQPPKRPKAARSLTLVTRVPSFRPRIDTRAEYPATSYRTLHCAAMHSRPSVFSCVTRYTAHAIYTGILRTYRFQDLRHQEILKQAGTSRLSFCVLVAPRANFPHSFRLLPSWPPGMPRENRRSRRTSAMTRGVEFA